MKQILAVTGNKSDYESNTLFAKRFNEVAKDLGLYKERNKRRDTHNFKDVGAVREEAKREALKENNALKEQIQELKNENTSLKKSNSTLKGQNTKLKKENETLKFDKKELENQIKDLSKNLRETLKELGALRPQYAQLEQLNKNLNEDLKNKVLDHEKVVKSYEDLEKNLREELTKKDEKINDLEVENKDLKSELEALKYQLDLKEKRSQSYFGLNKELKEEISSLKEQINALEEQKEDLEEKEDFGNYEGGSVDENRPIILDNNDFVHNGTLGFISQRVLEENCTTCDGKDDFLKRFMEYTNLKKICVLQTKVAQENNCNKQKSDEYGFLSDKIRFLDDKTLLIKKCFYEEIKLEECCKTAEDFCKDENINIKKVSFDLDYLRIGNLILDDIKRNPKLFDTELFKAENINLYLINNTLLYIKRRVTHSPFLVY